MYKRVSIALRNPKVSIFLRLATLVLLGTLAWLRLNDIEYSGTLVEFSLLLPLLLVAALSVLNLSAEAAKYRRLYGRNQLEFVDAFLAILAGMSVGIWTPNRVGEFAGRLRYAPSRDRMRSMGATVAGSALQGGVTILLGCVGLFLFDFNFDLPNHWNLVLVGTIILALALILILRKGPLASFRRKHIEISLPQLLSGLGWAFLRYAIFSSQFVIILFAFGFNGSALEAFSGVFLLYAIQSYVPGSFLSELGVREVLSVLFFSPFFANPIGAPLAAFCLWVLNIGLPIVSWSLYSGVKKLEG